MVILELIHALKPDFWKGCVYLLQNHFRLCLTFGESGYLMDCVASAGDDSFKLLTYQLPTVGYWPTLAMTGNGELGFDTGEGA